MCMATLWLATAALGGDAEPAHDKASGRSRLALTPILGVSTYRPPDSADRPNNLALGATGSFSWTTPGTLGIAGRARVSYLGLVGADRKGREWRAGVTAGPRLGTKPGKLGELSLTLLTGAEFVNDTYRFESLGDSPRVPQAWLVDVPLRARLVLAIVDAELSIAPSFFLDRQSGPTEVAPEPRASREGLGDELQMTSSLGLRFGSAFRVGLSQRTRWTSYGRLSVFGILFGIDTL